MSNANVTEFANTNAVFFSFIVYMIIGLHVEFLTECILFACCSFGKFPYLLPVYLSHGALSCRNNSCILVRRSLRNFMLSHRWQERLQTAYLKMRQSISPQLFLFIQILAADLKFRGSPVHSRLYSFSLSLCCIYISSICLIFAN
jgi:hypothetical protein